MQWLVVWRLVVLVNEWATRQLHHDGNFGDTEIELAREISLSS
jgi:hypothetical protein